MKARRNELGFIVGDLDYGGTSYPVTMIETCVPLLYVCSKCNAITYHIVGEQPTGVGFKLPFTRKPLATTGGKGYHLICNECTMIARQLDNEEMEKVQGRIIPNSILKTLDSFFRMVENIPKAYTSEFPKFWAGFQSSKSDDLTPEDLNHIVTILSVYRREDGE